MATQLKKEGSPGRVVKLDRNKTTTLKTLRTTKIEGVGEYVTCKEGDVRSLPFDDNYFNVVVSGVFVHTVGKEYGKRTVEAATEKARMVGEVVRVLNPGGVEVVWDLRLHVPEYVRKLQELKWRTFGSPSRSLLLWSVAISFRFGSPVSTSLGPARSGSNGTANFTYLHYIFFFFFGKLYIIIISYYPIDHI